MSKALNISAKEFDEMVLKSPTPVLVDFWAAWCGPCMMMAPILDQLAEKLEGKLKIVKIDIEDPSNLELAQNYDIRSIPNMKLFKNGAVSKEFIGARPKEIFIKELQDNI